MSEIERLRTEVERRFGTIHRFCRATGLQRSTTYQVLGGRYPGNLVARLAAIRAALTGAEPQEPVFPPEQAEETIFQALGQVACARCKRPDGRKCRGCRNLWREQARAAAQKVLEG